MLIENTKPELTLRTRSCRKVFMQRKPEHWECSNFLCPTHTTWCRLIERACLERSLLNLFQQLIGLEGALMSQPHPPLQHGIKVSVLIVVHSAGYLRHFETAPPHPHRCEPHQLFSWSLHTCGANSESIGDRWSMTHFLGVTFIIWINREKPSYILMVTNMIDPTWLINHPISTSHRIASPALLWGRFSVSPSTGATEVSMSLSSWLQPSLHDARGGRCVRHPANEAAAGCHPRKLERGWAMLPEASAGHFDSKTHLFNSGFAFMEYCCPSPRLLASGGPIQSKLHSATGLQARCQLVRGINSFKCRFKSNPHQGEALRGTTHQNMMWRTNIFNDTSRFSSAIHASMQHDCMTQATSSSMPRPPGPPPWEAKGMTSAALTRHRPLPGNARCRQGTKRKAKARPKMMRAPL